MSRKRKPLTEREFFRKVKRPQRPLKVPVYFSRLDRWMKTAEGAAFMAQPDVNH
jgi:hypothetical protein